MKVKMNPAGRAQILKRGRQALMDTAQDVLADLKSGGTMPFKSGHLQNEATSVVVGNCQDTVSIVSDAVYARRKYFNPQFEFDRSVNRRAGGEWFDTINN